MAKKRKKEKIGREVEFLKQSHHNPVQIKDTFNERIARYIPFIGLFVTAFIIRLVFIFQKEDIPIPFEMYEGTDCLSYHQTALEMINGQWNQAPFVQAPAYQYLVALVYFICSPQPFFMNVLQALIGSITCILLVFIALRIMDKVGAWCVGILSALYQMWIFYDGLLLQESFISLFTTLYLLLGVNLQRMSAVNASVLLGTLGGVSCLFKPIFLPLLFFLTLYLNWSTPKFALQQLKIFGISWGIVFLILLPLLGINASSGAGWVISLNGPAEFIDGNYAGVSGIAQY